MSNEVFFISDHHLNHNNILKFAGEYRDGDTVAEHNQILIDKHNSIVGKRDVVYFLGDVFFKSVEEGIELCKQMKGIKHLIMGNHDRNAIHYHPVFQGIYGHLNYKGYHVTHAPIHPLELRGERNIMGHMHMGAVVNGYGEVDERYINVCVEQCNGFPVNFEDIKSGKYKSRLM